MLHFFLLTSNSLVVFVNLVFMSVSAPIVCLWTTCLSLQHLSVCGPSVRLWTTRLSLFRLFSTVGRLEEQLRSFDQSLKSFQAAEDKVQYDCWQPSVAPPPPPPPDLQRALVLRCLFSSSSYFFCCSSNFMTNALQHKRTHTQFRWQNRTADLCPLWPLICSKCRLLEEELRTIFSGSKSLEAQADKVGGKTSLLTNRRCGLGGLQDQKMVFPNAVRITLTAVRTRCSTVRTVPLRLSFYVLVIICLE